METVHFVFLLSNKWRTMMCASHFQGVQQSYSSPNLSRSESPSNIIPGVSKVPQSQRTHYPKIHLGVSLVFCLYSSRICMVQSTLDISKLWGLFFTSSIYPKCKLICTKGNLDLQKSLQRESMVGSRYPSSRYRESTVI